MEPETVLSLMVGHHSKIMDMLEELGPKNIDAFDKFKWELEKHIFIEERAVFLHYVPTGSEDYNMFLKLTNEHSKILEVLEAVEKDIKKGVDLNLSELKELLIGHSKYEEDQFYPKLDSELEGGQKKVIRRRIRSMK